MAIWTPVIEVPYNRDTARRRRPEREKHTGNAFMFKILSSEEAIGSLLLSLAKKIEILNIE